MNRLAPSAYRPVRSECSVSVQQTVESERTSQRAASGASGANRSSIALAPLVGIVRPAQAANTLAAAPWGRFVLTFLMYAALCGVRVVILAIWYTAWLGVAPRVRWDPSLMDTRALLAAMLNTWLNWHQSGFIGPAEQIFAATVALIAAGAAFLAWLYLPFVHDSKSVATSFARAFRSVAAGGGLLLVLTIGVGAALASGFLNESFGGAFVPTAVPLMIILPIGCWMIVIWVSRAVHGVEPVAAPEIPPTCEGCGYDLTLRTLDDVCPECGLSVAISVGPHPRRRGVRWERDTRGAAKQVLNWLHTSRQVMFHPRAFYEHLQVRRNDAAPRRFALICNVALGLAAPVVFLALMLMQSGPSGLCADEIAVAATAILLCAPMGCWFGHRVGAAVVCTWWIYTRALPDLRWARKIVGYESAFLWAYAAFWSGLGASYVWFDNWPTELLGVRFGYDLLGVPNEVALVYMGTVLLSVVWLWRYAIALRAIRWSNV